MKNKMLFSALLALMMVIVSACGSAAPTATAMPATSAPVIPITGKAINTPVPTEMSKASPSAPALLQVSQNSTLGSFLVDSNGMTLYAFTNDTPGMSTCSGSCATNWPPLLTNGAPTAGTGVTTSMLGTLTRSDGSVQVTYNGWPLYYFIKDKVTGDTLGEGILSKWYVISPEGMQPSPAMLVPSATSALAASGNGV